MATPPTPPSAPPVINSAAVKPQLGAKLTDALGELGNGAIAVKDRLVGATDGLGAKTVGAIETGARTVETVAAAPLRWAGKLAQRFPGATFLLAAVGTAKAVSSYMESRDEKKQAAAAAVLEAAHGNELPGSYDADPNFGTERPRYGLPSQPPVAGGFAEREAARRAQASGQHTPT